MNVIKKKILKIVDSYGIKYVTVFLYDKDNMLLDSFYWEFFTDDVDEYADWVEETWQEEGIEIIVEKMYKFAK